MCVYIYTYIHVYIYNLHIFVLDHVVSLNIWHHLSWFDNYIFATCWICSPCDVSHRFAAWSGRGWNCPDTRAGSDRLHLAGFLKGTQDQNKVWTSLDYWLLSHWFAWSFPQPQFFRNAIKRPNNLGFRLLALCRVHCWNQQSLWYQARCREIMDV